MSKNSQFISRGLNLLYTISIKWVGKSVVSGIYIYERYPRMTELNKTEGNRMLTKQKYKKQMARILTVLLAVAVTVCFVPQMNVPRDWL